MQFIEDPKRYAGLIFGLLIIIVVRIWVRRTFLRPSRNKSTIILKNITIYPVKACKGISVDRAKIGRFGLENDRRWMLYNTENNRFLTQRQYPKMALITPSFVGNYLQLDFPGATSIKIPLSGKDQRQEPIVNNIGLWKTTVRGVDEGDLVANWFANVLKPSNPVRLIRLPSDHDRSVPSEWAEKDLNDQLVSYADGFPFLLGSEESLADLNSRLPQGTEPLPMRRFRPNFIVGGLKSAFDEDNWKRIRIGNTVFRPVKKCTRCKVTTVDPDKGEFAGNEPLATLATYRKGLIPKDKDEVCFAQNLIHESIGGEVRVGQKVEILS